MLVVGNWVGGWELAKAAAAGPAARASGPHQPTPSGRCQRRGAAPVAHLRHRRQHWQLHPVLAGQVDHHGCKKARLRACEQQCSAVSEWPAGWEHAGQRGRHPPTLLPRCVCARCQRLSRRSRPSRPAGGQASQAHLQWPRPLPPASWKLGCLAASLPGPAGRPPAGRQGCRDEAWRGAGSAAAHARGTAEAAAASLALPAQRRLGSPAQPPATVGPHTHRAVAGQRAVAGEHDVPQACEKGWGGGGEASMSRTQRQRAGCARPAAAALLACMRPGAAPARS